MVVAPGENAARPLEGVRRRKAIAVGLRARLPVIGRIVALILIVAGLTYVTVSYLKLRSRKPFVMIPGEAKLSKEVVSEVSGYERRVTEGEKLRLLVTAAKDITFSDGHHELANVTVQSYPESGGQPDEIKANRSIYDQENQIISFAGAVNIQTRDALKVNSEQVIFNQKSGVAEVPVPVTFSRENIEGSANAATLKSNEKNLNLRGDVAITVTPDEKTLKSGGKDAERKEPLTIKSSTADFDQNSFHLSFKGGATAEQGRDVMSGDTLSATLNAEKKIQKLDVNGNSYLRSMAEGHAAEMHSRDMEFFFNADQKLERAVATNQVQARTLNADSQAEISGAERVEALFAIQSNQSELKEIHTNGRSVLKLGAPQSRAQDPRSASKQLTADAVNLFWRTSGRDLERAEATGNAELIVLPVIVSPKAEKKTLTAPRFDCSFYEVGNLLEKFQAGPNAVAVIQPLDQSRAAETKTITAQQMTATFVRETQDVEVFNTAGGSKFTEADKNGTAETITYTALDRTVRLRGNEPTVWDSRARAKANEIDSDLDKGISYGRGKSSTTYYSQEQTNGSAPFQSVKSPVYVTSDRFEIQHDSGVGIYTGSARMWQQDNFVSAERILLNRNSRRMEATGKVQSALYQTRGKGRDGSNSVPVFATSEKMFYSDPDRLVHYEANVDIRQGTDRITGGVADVYLQKDKAEVDHTVVQKDVVLTQPGRRATGNWAQYLATQDIVELKGSPATAEDAEQGNTRSERLTVYLRENKVVADDPGGGQSTGRVRSTHKVTKLP